MLSELVFTAKLLYYNITYIRKNQFFPSIIMLKKLLSKTIDFNSYICSRLLTEPLVYVVGDSHTTVFKNKKMFIVHHIGPATMFNLNKKDSSTKSNEKLFHVVNKINPKKDVLMLVFGEIDCRIHIYNQYQKQNKKFTIAELIDKTILNYGNVLEKIKSMGIKFYVYGIPATGSEENSYKYPFYGTPQIRSEICKEFNSRLKNFCVKNNYAFIDIYPKISDKNGFLLKEFATDEVHLNTKIVDFVRQELNKNRP